MKNIVDKIGYKKQYCLVLNGLVGLKGIFYTF